MCGLVQIWVEMTCGKLLYHNLLEKVSSTNCLDSEASVESSNFSE